MGVSVQDVAIIFSNRAGTLAIGERTDRWGDKFAVIYDDRGTIEVAKSVQAATGRVNSVIRAHMERKAKSRLQNA
jgi:hypothetical protein